MEGTMSSKEDLHIDDRERAKSLAEEWLQWDKDPVTRDEIQSLVNGAQWDQLIQRMHPRLAFGTAGLRARVQGGFARLNALTIIQTSQGLAEHVINTYPKPKSPAQRLVVIGYDGRRDSHRFAELTAAAFAAKRFGIIFYHDKVHTPLVPFGVKHFEADVGVMITASHNPKEDNGYKVYVRTGCQINTPEDEAIAQSIQTELEPLSWLWDQRVAVEDARLKVAEAYFSRISQMVSLKGDFGAVIYTAMHGVGLPYIIGALEELLANRGSGRLASRSIRSTMLHYFKVVEAQAHPDPDFPTVAYPNPEEEGALDLAKAQADELGIHLIIANDPDADRFAAAQKVDGRWYQFTGDEVGVLLGYYIWQKVKSRGTQGERCVMLTSAVSSQMLAAIGGATGFEVEETLTGFKWIGDRARVLGDSAVFGYEEALGYMMPQIVHDKDGVSAAMLFLEACEAWSRMPYDVLQELYFKFGYFQTVNTYWKSPEQPLTIQTFQHIRLNVHVLFKVFHASTKSRIRDLSVGFDTGDPRGQPALPWSADSLMLTVWLQGDTVLEDGVRCTIRASGTEPKIKVYVECKSRRGKEEARKGAIAVLKAVRHSYFTDPRLKMETKYEQETSRV